MTKLRSNYRWWLPLLATGLYVMPETQRETVFTVAAAISLLVAGAALHRRPDRWQAIDRLFIGAALLFTAAVARAVHAGITGVEFPFPSPADALAVAGYVLIIWALMSIARSRRAFVGQGDALDVVMVSVAMLGPFWVGFMEKYLSDPSFSMSHRGLSLVYALTEVVFAATLLRLATGPALRSRSYWLMATSVMSILITDVVAILSTIGYPGGRLLIPVATVGFVSFAMLAGDPDHAGLFQRPPASSPDLTKSRLVSISVSTLMLPVLALLQIMVGGELLITAVFTAILAVLVLIRVVGLLRARDNMARLDSQLNETSQDIITAEDPKSIAFSLNTAIGLIFGSSSSFAATIRSREGGVSARRVKGRTLETADVSWEAGHDLEQLDKWLGTFAAGDVIEMPLGQDGGAVLVAPGESMEHSQQLALQAMTAHAALALHNITMREDAFRQRAERRLHALVEQSTDLVMVADADDAIHFVSPNAPRILGMNSEEIADLGLAKLAHEDDVANLLTHLHHPTQPADSSNSHEARLKTASGDFRWFEVSTRDFADDPEVGGVVVTARDITEERAAKLGLQRSEEWFRGLVQNSSDVIGVVDENGSFTYASPAVFDLLGQRPDQIQGRNVLELLPPDQVRRIQKLRDELAHGDVGDRTIEVALAHASGQWRTVEVTLTDRRSDDAVRGLVLNIRDITDRKKLEEDLRHQILHDDLTGLGSRVQFTDNLTNALRRQNPGPGKVAVLFIDVDDFKNVNDSLGHAAGDQVLVEISSRLLGRLRLQDKAARFGGDEFAVLLTDVYTESDITTIADRVVEELSRPVRLMGSEIRLSVSVGIAVDNDGSQSHEDLLRSADVAMYEAKGLGKGRWAMYESGMADQTVERFEISNALGAAIENDELMLYYQPIVDLASGKTVGVEALVRWFHPIRGMVSPESFIPLAEQNGMIIPLGRSVLESAVNQAAKWRNAGHDIYISINVSPVQLRTDGIVEEILSVVDASGIDHEAVVLELTEMALIDDFELIVNRIDRLRAEGLRVAIDDFGTGNATLRYAEVFSADILKIDRSFVMKLEHSERSSVVSTVLGLAHDMGATTIAEGIELPIQHSRLRTLGCRYGQGYYFTRPAPPEQIEATLKGELEGERMVGHTH